MNILFIDYCYKLDNMLEYKITNINKKIYYLKLSLSLIDKSLKNKNKLKLKILKLRLKHLFKNKKVYVVLSKKLDELYDEDLKIIYFRKLLEIDTKNYTLVTKQNNLLNSDNMYINEYLENNKISRKDVKVLCVIDKLDNIVKSKIEENILKYKTVDIYMTNIDRNSVNYVNNINEKLGSTIDILDKLNFEYYNVFLVFSKAQKLKVKSSFILDYNNSEQDTKSITYLMYENNADKYIKIFKLLDVNVSSYNKTKLGKLYIHASRLILDI